MEKIFISSAQVVKKIENIGFSFSEAMEIYRVVSKELLVLDGDEMYFFIDDLFIKDTNGAIQAKEMYSIYRKWSSKHGIEPLTITSFGKMMSKVFNKSKINGHIYYEARLR